MVIQMLTQRPLIAWFRKQQVMPSVRVGVSETVNGLQEGARNMIGIAIACGTAGLIVGAITLTGLGLHTTTFVDVISMGGVLQLFSFSAAFVWSLGLGLLPPANYFSLRPLLAHLLS